MELLKKYSTLDEVLAFLKDKTGYEYSIRDIYELNQEKKLDVYFLFEHVMLRSETINNDGKTEYEFEYMSLEAIYEKAYPGSVFMTSGPNSVDVAIPMVGLLKVHELLEDYWHDKSPFNPIPYDKDNKYIVKMNNFKSQAEIFKHVRFKSEQVLSLVNYNAKKDNLIEHLKKENTQLRVELARKQSVETQGYLDPDNKFYSIEMRLCHDTWNYLYNSGLTLHDSHSKEVKKYLENYPDLEVNIKAIKRITTITNPKTVLAKSDSDK